MNYSDISDEENTSWFDIEILEKMDGEGTLSSSPTGTIVAGDGNSENIGVDLSAAPSPPICTTASVVSDSAAVPICSTAGDFAIPGPSSATDFAPCTWDFATSRQLRNGLPQFVMSQPTYTSPADLKLPQAPTGRYPHGGFAPGFLPNLVSGCVSSASLTPGRPPAQAAFPQPWAFPPPAPAAIQQPWAFTPVGLHQNTFPSQPIPVPQGFADPASQYAMAQNHVWNPYMASWVSAVHYSLCVYNILHILNIINICVLNISDIGIFIGECDKYLEN